MIFLWIDNERINWLSFCEIAKNFQNFVINNVLTKYLIFLTKEIYIDASFNKKFNKFDRRKFVCINESKIKNWIIRKIIDNNDNDNDLFNLFVEFFNFAMFDLKKRWNLNVLKMINNEKILLKKINLKNMQKIFDDKQMSKCFYN